MLMRLLVLVGIFAAASLPAEAEALLDDLPQGGCEVFERTVLLFDRPSALGQTIVQTLGAYDQARALQPNSRRRAAGALFCEGGSFDLSGLSEAETSARLSSFAVLVRVLEGNAQPVRVYAHAPELVLWAGDPFVPLDAFAWQDAPDLDLADAIPPALDRAYAFAEALQYFHAGDLDGAVAARPSPGALPALPRAWLSGIPLRIGGSGFFLADQDQYDPAPSRGGKRQFELLLAVAREEVSPSSAIKLSIPANDVLCGYGESHGTEEVRWAGFVSGFWQSLDMAALHPNARLDEVGPMLAPQRTCFASPIYDILDRWSGQLDAERLLSRLDLLVGSTMGRPEGPADRQRLAREMLATTLAAAALAQESIQDDEEARTRLREAEWRGRCTGPAAVAAAPAAALVAAVRPAESSPLALPLDLARTLSTSRLGEARRDLAPMLRRGSYEWLATRVALANFESWLADRDPAAATTLRRTFQGTGAQTAVAAILDILLTADETTFEAERERLSNDLYSFPRQSELALLLLGHSISADVRTLVAQRDTFGFFDPDKRRAYERLRLLLPWLVDQESLDELFGMSGEDAIRVAGIDLLNLYFSASLADFLQGVPDLAQPTASDDSSGLLFPKGRRNPWLEFAPDAQSLPEIPIPNIGGIDPVAVVAVSAVIHGLFEDVRLEDGAPVFSDDLDEGRYAAPVAVSFDKFYRSLLQRDPVEAMEVYLPSGAATDMLDIMEASAALARGPEAEPLPGLSDLPLDNFATWRELIEYAWHGLGAYVEADLAASAKEERASALIRELDVALRIGEAFFQPNETNGMAAARLIFSRLQQEDPDWPAPIRRIAAWLALELMGQADPESEAESAANRAGLLAEFDRLIEPEVRQKLIDAGFLPAALAGLPFRLAFLSRDHGGLDAIPPRDLLDAVLAEVERFDYRAAARDGPLQELAGVALAFASELDASPDRFAPVFNSPFGDDVRAILTHVRKLTGIVTPSREAEAIARLTLVHDLTDRAETEAERSEAMAGIHALNALCPELAPTLAAWRAQVDVSLDDSVADNPEAATLFTDVQYRTAFVSIRISALGLGVFLYLDPGLPMALSSEPTGTLSFLVQFVPDLDTPWQIETATGVVSIPDTGSPAFALALYQAERAAAGEASQFAEILAVLESELVDFVASTENSPTRSNAPDETDQVLGVPWPPAHRLSLQAGHLPEADLRLLRLAGQAEARGLPALARRIAGAAVGLALELAYEAEITEVMDPAQSLRDVELTSLRRMLAEEMPHISRESGFWIARAIASARIPVPVRFSEAVLCMDAAGAHLACSAVPSLTGDLAETNAGTPPCEQAARAALGRGPAGDASELCSGKLLEFDLAELRGASAALETYADLGIAPLAMVRDPDRLVALVHADTSEAVSSGAAAVFADATVVALSMGIGNLARHFALLHFFALVAESHRDVLDPAAQNLARSLNGIDDPRAESIAARLARDPAIGDRDRQFARDLVGEFLRER